MQNNPSGADFAAAPIALAAPVLRPTRQARIAWGDHVVTVGGGAPVRIQSMTNTDTVDAIGTAIQVKELALAGSELVRITVNTPEAAQAVPHIREQLDRMGIAVPLVGDFHYNGHRLLSDFPACAQALSKYRINPGNVGKGEKKDRQFAQMIEIAARYDKAVRIGVNWGSLDQELLAQLMDANAQRTPPWDARQVMYEALITSAITSAQRAEELGLKGENILLSCKVRQDRSVYTNGAPLRHAPHRPDRSGHGHQGHGGHGSAGHLARGIGETTASLTPASRRKWS